MVSSYIQFEDANTKQSLINDNTINIDGDHEISYKEAAAYNTSPATITIAGESFKEFQYFTGLIKCQIYGANLRILALPPNIQSRGYGTQALTYNCPNLEELIIIAPFNSNCDYPFSQNTKLEKVTVVNDTDDILTSNLGYNGWFSNSSNGGYFYYNNAILEHIIVNNATSINNCIFRLDKHIKSINCNNKIRSIGSSSFFGSKLEEITNTNSVTYIGEGAFRNTKLESAIFNSVTSNILGVFALCTDLINVELQSATTLGVSNSYGAFDGCTNLESCDSPNLTNIGDCSFKNCNKLVSLNCSPITIGDWAFYGCSKFEGFISTSNITSIGIAAFASCPKFDHKDFNNVTSIGISSFSNSGITDVEFKNQSFVTIPGSNGGSISAGTGAFDNCTKLTKIDAPYVTSVGRYGFRNCSLLTTINMPNVTDIGNNAFANCTSLTGVNWNWNNIKIIEAGAFLNCNSLNINSIVFDANSVLTNIISTQNADGPFKGSSIKNITINNNIMTTLNGFTGTSMTSIVAPNVTVIGNYCFYGGSVTNMMSFPNVTLIGVQAFYQTYLGNNIDLYNVIKFDHEAFYGCTSLRSLGNNFNWNTVKYIGDGAFSRTNIIMPRELNCKIVGHDSFNLNGDSNFPNINSHNEKYVILRFDGSDISDINDYPTGTNGQDLIRKGVVGFIPFLDFKRSPFGAVQVVYVPDSEPDENNKTIKDYYLESIWGQLAIRTSSTLLSFRTHSEGIANDGISIT